MKRLTCLSIYAAVTLLPSACLGNDVFSLVVQSEYSSEYIFRGVTRSDDAVQTSAEASVADITIGVWTSFGLEDDQGLFTDEIDVYAFTGWMLGDAVAAEVGATLYHFPQLGGFFDIGDDVGDGSTIEVYGGLDFDVPLQPRLTGYYDVHREAVTVEGGLSYPIAVGSRIQLEPRLIAGLVEDSDPDGVDYQYSEASVRFGISVSDQASLFTSGHYAISTEDTFIDTDFSLSDPDSVLNPQRNAAWFKIGLSATY